MAGGWTLTQQPALPKAVGAWMGGGKPARSHPQEEELGCAVVFQRLSAVKTLSWPCQGTFVGEKELARGDGDSFLIASWKSFSQQGW